MYDIPLDFHVSPLTKEQLTKVDDSTLRDESGNEFKLNAEHGFWEFLPDRSPIYSDDEWNSFQTLIDNFVISYDRDPGVNVSYDERPDALQFGEFCNYHGDILDIGCGPHKVPSYIKFKRNEEAKYYGIDILVGEQPKEHNFVQAMGEHLPYRDNLFDITISGTSILHYVSPIAGIKEALRVTKPKGYLCIRLGVKSGEAPVPKESPEWYEKLDIPEGAVNPFHYNRYSEDVFDEIIKKGSGKIDEKQVHQVDEWRKNIFYRVIK